MQAMQARSMGDAQWVGVGRDTMYQREEYWDPYSINNHRLFLFSPGVPYFRLAYMYYVWYCV